MLGVEWWWYYYSGDVELISTGKRYEVVEVGRFGLNSRQVCLSFREHKAMRIGKAFVEVMSEFVACAVSFI